MLATMPMYHAEKIREMREAIEYLREGRQQFQ